MRRVVFTIIFIVLFVVACSSQSRQSELKSLEGVRLYSAMHENVVYSDRVFSGEDAKLFADVVKTECPAGDVGNEFVRTELDARTSKLVIYSDKSGKNITCSVLKPGEQKEIVLKTAADAPEGVALSVNGEPIALEVIRSALAALPENQRDEASINVALNQIINDELLRQETQKYEVTPEEIAAARASILEQAGLTEATLAIELERQKVTAAQFEESVVQQAKLQRLLDERLLVKEIAVTDQDALTFYVNNPNQFLQTEQAVMRQVFIAAEGRGEEQIVGRAQAAVAALQSQDFCEVVKSYSDDAQSKENCGVYVVPRGVIDPNLELAAFSTPVNQTAVVTTQNGVHLVQTLQVTPASVVPYSQIAANLQANLRNTVLQQRLNLYLSSLRADADIVSYLG